MNFILNKKLKYYTKEILKCFNIIIMAFAIIIAIILIKYKPIYEISISGKELGYIENKQAFEERIKENTIGNKEENIDSIDIKTSPQYELKFVDRKVETNEEEIASTIKQDIVVTYKYYEINLNNETIDSVNTLKEAEELVNKVKSENKDKEFQLSIVIKYTENAEEIKTTNIEIAKSDIQTKFIQKFEEQQIKQKEQERINSMPQINGIRIAYAPTKGIISSRYGSIDSVRNYRTHGGIDIAAPMGTEIRAVASGTVTTSGMQGGYGNMIKINHGNGVETYYGHCSRLYVKKGQYVEAGQVIATVGSTGNSTGPHLHLEIRLNGQTVNPQNYLYNR